MEARWLSYSYDDALGEAIPEGIDLDAYTCATIAALLAGYYDYYGEVEKEGKLNPEVQFGPTRLEGTEFVLEGKIDGLGSLSDNRSALIEGKTTGDSLAPDSDYWMRLRFNMQVMNYATEARNLGWDLSVILYDVVRKPSIRPKRIDDLDSQGRKIVLDQSGKRVFLLAGKNKGEPRQSGDGAKGYFIKDHLETPDEFSDRLWSDTKARPEFYFVRKEVALLHDELQMFERQRYAIAKMIRDFRANEPDITIQIRDAEAWPRHVSSNTCDFCSYKSFCLQNITIDVNQPPEGFSLQPFNPELDKYEQTAITEDSSNPTV